MYWWFLSGVKWVAYLIFLPCIAGAILLGLFRIIPIELWIGAALSLAIIVFVAREERKNPDLPDEGQGPPAKGRHGVGAEIDDEAVNPGGHAPMDETFRKVEQHLRTCLPPGVRAKPITPETELYRDLGFYGDTLAFDVIIWAHREFGMEGTFRLDDYAPGEMPTLLRPLAKLVGKEQGFL